MPGSLGSRFVVRAWGGGSLGSRFVVRPWRDVFADTACRWLSDKKAHIFSVYDSVSVLDLYKICAYKVEDGITVTMSRYETIDNIGAVTDDNTTRHNPTRYTRAVDSHMYCSSSSGGRNHRFCLSYITMACVWPRSETQWLDLLASVFAAACAGGFCMNWSCAALCCAVLCCALLWSLWCSVIYSN